MEKMRFEFLECNELYRVSQLIWNDIFDDVKKNGYEDLGKIVSYILNASLASEIGLKGIISGTQKNFVRDNANANFHTHNLLELFNMIDDDNIKEEIIHDMQNYASDNITNEFMICLEDISANFVNWRYYYEKDQKTNLLFLHDFLKSIIHYINK